MRRLRFAVRRALLRIKDISVRSDRTAGRSALIRQLGEALVTLAFPGLQDERLFGGEGVSFRLYLDGLG